MKIYVNLSQATDSVPKAGIYVKFRLKPLNLTDSQVKDSNGLGAAIARGTDRGSSF